ncbi:molybdate ABC transporter substrate-binding protein [Chitinimonas lacunae]|uniref:Molybdate ABC transporter substrate-binding protein n=1 Tax=Chitinimonas lacunae TaxID=1963018 RepID=A0ABV8ML20_9NEIS
MRLSRRSLLLCCLLWSGIATAAETVRVAVAANFHPTAQQLAQRFEAEQGIKVELSSGSTGKLYAQIKQGAPFELLLSADDETPERLLREGNAVSGSARVYAVGRLVLWSAKPGLVDPAGEVLKRGAFNKLAMANPKTAPYGAAAEAVLAGMGLLDGLRPRLVVGENVAQTQQFIASGNAELGFIARSQVSAGSGSLWLVPAERHTPLRQAAVLLRPGRDKAAARRFLDYLVQEPARRLIAAAGYDLP